MATVSLFRLPGEVIFGAGAIAQLCDKAEEFKAQRVLLVTDKGLASTPIPGRARQLLEDAGKQVDIFDEVAGEPSLETLEACRARVAAGSYGLVVGIGGGSAMDVAKASACLAFNEGPARRFIGTNLIPNPGLPVIAAPTTAGTASEVTPNAIFGDASDNVKKGIVSKYLLPKVALVDPELTYTSPAKVTAASGMDALVHGIESYISPRATVLTRMAALESIRLISANLRRAVADGGDTAAREAMAWGSLIAGFSFANAGVGGVHALAYPLGGTYHVAHGVANALLLAPVMRFGAGAKPALFADIARAMGVRDEGQGDARLAEQAVEAMETITRDVGIPMRLRDLGVPQSAVAPMAAEAIKIERLLVNNPRPMSEADIRDIYARSW